VEDIAIFLLTKPFSLVDNLYFGGSLHSVGISRMTRRKILPKHLGMAAKIHGLLGQDTTFSYSLP